MSHQINIPAALEFRPRPVRWELGEATVFGFKEREDGTEDSDRLSCNVVVSGNQCYGITIPTGSLDSRVREAIFAGQFFPESDRVRDVCEGYVLHGVFAIPDATRQPQLADAYAMRREFLSVQSGTEHLLAFLRKWGAWKSSESLLDEDDFFWEQRTYLKALKAGADDWFSHNSFPFGLVRSLKTIPYILLLAEDCTNALRLTTTLDFLHNSRFGVCAREDCGRIFKMETRREKKYCCWDCGHKVAVRNNRKRGKKQG